MRSRGGRGPEPVLFQAQRPIVIDVITQPPFTPEISYGGVLLSAVGVIGVVFIGGILVGLCIGGVVIWRKRRREAIDPVEHSHITLRLG